MVKVNIYIERIFCTLLSCIVVCFCTKCNNLSDNKLPSIVSSLNLVIDIEAETISLCSNSTDCQCYRNIFESKTVKQIEPMIFPQGSSVNITVYSNNETLLLYKTPNLEQFHSCKLNNETPTFNSSTFEIQGKILNPGSHLFICNGPDLSDQKCLDGCRLNLTIKQDNCINRATNIVCSGNGKCTSLNNENTFSCKCLDGFGGDTCEMTYAYDKLSVCTESYCRNGGTCFSNESQNSSANTSTIICECPPHFTGQYCETILNNCKSSPCVNGVCVEHVDGYQCYCVPGFHGKNCELEYNECLSNPCLNRGTCIDRVDKFECRCSVGYHGDTCRDKIDLCQTSPCHRNSTCTTIDEKFTCLCQHGFTGKYCDERVKACSSNPCKNHGTCIEYENGYQCMCQVTFAGIHCEYMIDVFAPPMEGADLSGETHKHNMYIVAGTLGSMVLIVVSVIVACYCKVYETYKQLMWKRLRYHRKRSNSCPDLETCNEPNYIGKHRLSADAIWEATSLCHDNAAFENTTNHQTFTSMQI